MTYFLYPESNYYTDSPPYLCLTVLSRFLSSGHTCGMLHDIPTLAFLDESVLNCYSSDFLLHVL